MHPSTEKIAYMLRVWELCCGVIYSTIFTYFEVEEMQLYFDHAGIDLKTNQNFIACLFFIGEWSKPTKSGTHRNVIFMCTLTQGTLHSSIVSIYFTIKLLGFRIISITNSTFCGRSGCNYMYKGTQTRWRHVFF